MKVIDFERYLEFAGIIDKVLNAESDSLYIYRTLLAVERLLTITLQPFRKRLSPEEVERDNTNMSILVTAMGTLYKAREILMNESPEFAEAVAGEVQKQIEAGGALDEIDGEHEGLIKDILSVITEMKEEEDGSD